MISSPCIGLCRIDPTSGLCEGCVRSGAEIAAWGTATAAARAGIWAELPARRAAREIKLHRPGWSSVEIRRFVRATLRAGGGSWTVGGYGATARFAVGGGEPCAVVEEETGITAATPRGAIRFTLGDRVRLLAVRVEEGRQSRDLLILAVPRSRNPPQPHVGLTALGPDRDAIRPEHRGDRLFDLGLASEAGAFCIRTGDSDLIAALDRRIGRNWSDLLDELGDRIVRESPARVVLSPVARVEVGTPITPGGEPESAGPRTELSPHLLRLGRETPPALEVPESFILGAILDPEPGAGAWLGGKS